MAKQTTRRSPVDDENLLQIWRDEHRHNTKELGLSNRQSYYRIAEKYACSSSTVEYWVHENARRRAIQRKRDTYIPYAQNPRIKQKRLQNRLRTDLVRHPDIYLKEVYCGRETPLSLDEITLHLHLLTSILMRNKSLLDCVDRFRLKYGKELLVPTAETPPRYYFRG